MNDIRRRYSHSTDQEAPDAADLVSENEGAVVPDGKLERASAAYKNAVRASASFDRKVRGNSALQLVQPNVAAGNHRPLADKEPRTRADKKPLRFDSFGALSRHLSET